MTIVNLTQLQQGNIEAWTYLVRQNPRLAHSSAIRVELSPASFGAKRATVFLNIQQDPLSFIVYGANAAEAQFLANYADKLSFLLPQIWFINNQDTVTGETGIVFEDVEPATPPEKWSLSDIDQVISQLAKQHAIFWQPRSEKFGWLPFSLARREVTSDPSDQVKFLYPRPGQLEIDDQMFPIFDLEILQKTRKLWPELLTKRHYQALKRLTREPRILLRPLLALPLTVLHGQPTIDRWRVTLFENSYLLHWSTVKIGPAVLDLDRLITSIPDEPRPDRAGRLAPWDTAVESILDSYFVALSESLHEHHGYGVIYSSRYMRRFALPAARCWLILNHHLPELLAEPEAAAGHRAAQLWTQFLDAFRLLTTYVKGVSEISIR